MLNMILIQKNERRRTLANIGQIYSKIPKNTPKIPQNAPKMSKTNVKNVKNEDKLSKFGRTQTLTMLPGPAQNRTQTLSMLPGPAHDRTQTMSKKRSQFLRERRQRRSAHNLFWTNEVNVCPFQVNDGSSIMHLCFSKIWKSNMNKKAK